MRALLIAVLLLSACTTSTDEEARTDLPTLLLTSETLYRPKVQGQINPSVRFDIPYETHNATPDTLYLTGCNRPAPVLLERLTESGWKKANLAIEQLCSYSIHGRILPGEMRRDTFRASGWLPRHNLSSFNNLIQDGTHRLKGRLSVAYNDSSQKATPFSPDRQVSNTFEIRVRR